MEKTPEEIVEQLQLVTEHEALMSLYATLDRTLIFAMFAQMAKNNMGMSKALLDVSNQSRSHVGLITNHLEAILHDKNVDEQTKDIVNSKIRRMGELLKEGEQQYIEGIRTACKSVGIDI